MFIADVTVVVGLLAAMYAWWRGKRALALAAAAVVLVVGSYGWLVDRWQYAPGVVVALVILVFVRSQRPQTAGGVWSASLLTIASLVTPVLIYLFPIINLPEPSGSHGVGVRDFVLRDDSRRGLLAAPEHVGRELLVRVWYPAQTAADDPRRPYFTDLEAASTAGGLGAFVDLPFLFRYVRHVQTNSVVDAPLITDAADLPVVIYSHGYTTFAGQNTALMEELASHGYLVFAVHHSHDSSPAVLPDGRVIDTDPNLFSDMRAGPEGETEGFLAGLVSPSAAARFAGVQGLYRAYLEEGYRIVVKSADIWVDDRRHVHDRLASGDVPANIQELAAVGNFERTGQAGMSFGGSTTGAFCQADRRCAAAVNMDGGDYHYDTTFGRNLSVPFLMLYSDLDALAHLLSNGEANEGRGFNDFSYERFETTGLREDVHRLMIRDVSHLGVSDFTLFLRNPLRGYLLGTIDPDHMLRIQNDFVRGFFDRYLRQMDNNFPVGELETHADRVMSRGTDAVREWWLTDHPEDTVVPIRMETNLGHIDVAIYPNRAPLSAAQFLAQVDAGTYTGTSLYRVTDKGSEPGSIAVVQGGRGVGAALAGDHIPAIAHETTDVTGISNVRGTMAFARLAPGTASTEFFFNVEDNLVLDTGSTVRNPDGQGYATFGRVISGLQILEQLASLPRTEDADMPSLRGEMLAQPVVIQGVRRLAGR